MLMRYLIIQFGVKMVVLLRQRNRVRKIQIKSEVFGSRFSSISHYSHWDKFKKTVYEAQ